MIRDAVIHLPRLQATLKSGSEPVHRGGVPLGPSLHDFWRWSASDLLSNATRGIVAEYLVAFALGLPPDAVRNEWDPFDLTTPEGVKVEVKSAAYIQCWPQKELSKINFSTRKTIAYDPETNEQLKDVRRWADVYVFALLDHTDQATIDPLDVAQWRFFVLPTRVLDERTRSQYSITLKSLIALAGEGLGFDGLRPAVLAAAGLDRRS